jgi:hypothetical protein
MDGMMDMMRKQQPGAEQAPAVPAPADTSMSDSSTAPMASPMSTPEPKMGTKEAAMVNLSMAMDLIEQSLPALGSESEEGQKALSVLRVLSGVLGQKKAKAGDLQATGLRQNVLVVREQNGQRVEYRLDLTSKEIYQSPAYYIRQNDVIYVEPNFTANYQGTNVQIFTQLGSTALSLILSVFTLISLSK